MTESSFPRIILNGGALEGADKFTRETALWHPSMRSPDAIINGAKPMADARGRDTVRNSGLAFGAVARHKDSVVGAQYRLNSRPNWRYLSQYSSGFDETWAEEYQQVVEARFNLLGDANDAWLDAMRVNTFTGMIRLAIGVFLITGEVIATAEWLRQSARPVWTAIQMVSGDRLSNPNGMPDTATMRRGIERDVQGQPLAYNFRMGDPLNPFPTPDAYLWNRVPARKPWGRKQVIHIVEQGLPDQSRGISDMVACMKNMHMTKKFSEVTLQSAIINATYAAAIESELPNDAVAVALGKGTDDTGAALLGVYGAYMGALGQYLDASTNIHIDGAQVPHLFPGTKLNMMPAKTAGGVGTPFEESLHRHTAASLGLSYEEFSRDFSKTNYSSGRAAMGVSAQYMAARKRHVADRFATEIFALVLEEDFSDDKVPLPRGITRDVFYKDSGLAKEAFTTCKWIGSGAGQIDEKKETDAAVLRIAAGLSTYEIEGARLGVDWRELFEQAAREQKEIKDRGLLFDLSNRGIAAREITAEEAGITPAASAPTGGAP